MAIFRFTSIFLTTLSAHLFAWSAGSTNSAHDFDSLSAEMARADQVQIESAGENGTSRKLAAISSSSRDSLDQDSSDEIEVNYLVDKLAPYNERKSAFGLTFSFGVEQIFPDAYVSKIDESTYEALYGTSSIDMYEGRMGVKYNTHLGGIEIGAVGGAGSIYDGRIAGTTNTDTDATLEIQKYGLYGSLIMDALFGEPYVAPYLEGQVFSYSWKEFAKSGESSQGWTGLSFGAKVGALFQLNWLDPRSALDAQIDYGLENTFVDLFTTYYQTTEDDDNPDFTSSLSFGFGIKFEF